MLLFLLAACSPDAPPAECACNLDTGVPDDTDTAVDDTDTAEPDTGEDDTGVEDTAGHDTDTGVTPPTPLQVYLLAGQSNMDGYAYVSGLPPSLQVAQRDVRLYWSGNGAWTDLMPASFGITYGIEYFGPEITFGRALADADPTGSHALIKHAVGGTDLATYWYPGTSRTDPSQGDGYRAFLTTIDLALADLDAESTDWEIAGMIWMQGESDAYTTLEQAEAYEGNLTAFIARVREDVAAPDMPFSIGKIHCPTCVYPDVVRAGQDAVAASVPNVVAFDTVDLPVNTDGIHYDGSGMRTLGVRFAQSLLDVPLSKTPSPVFGLIGSFSADYTGNFFLGYTFEVDRPITVTDLGTLDYGLTGMAYASEVAIYDTASGSLLARGIVPAWYTQPTAPWNNWRYVAIEPLDLEPGAYTIASQVFNGSEDRYIYAADMAAAEGFTWVEGLHKDGATVGMPVYPTSMAASWFGPNLLYLE
ncbi:MAG: sialate O-acetylesterase [Pseudomonadota bacterium]|nr:sialate O-acetylesterase [Pseudomonadota bacterium]